MPFTLVGAVHDRVRLAGAHDVELQGHYAYVTGKWGSFAVVDVSDAEAPRVVGALTEGIGDGETVLPMGDVCLVGADDLLAVDVRDPARPTVVKRIGDPTIRKINGMARWGSHVLAASKGRHVNVFDVADPKSPSLVGSLDTKRRGRVAAPHDIAAFGDRIAIVDQQHGSDTKLRVYRVGDARAGHLWPIDDWVVEGAVGAPSMDGANRIVVRGRYAFVANNHADSVSAIDLSDPAEPVLLATLPTAARGPCGLTRHRGVLLVACDRGVEAIDVADPCRPRSLGHVAAPAVFAGSDRASSDERRRRGGGHDLVFRDGLLYVTAQGSDGLAVFRVQLEP